MARAIWSGSIGFGLVNVPVKMYSAVNPKSVKFNQLSKETGAKIAQKRVDSSTGEEVPYENIVKGYDLGGRYVTIEPEELEAIAPKQVRRIELEQFVDGAEISPLLYGSSYYLGPDAAAGKAYDLLVQTLAQSGRVGIGKVILRTKEYLSAIRAENGVLVISTMAHADEINAVPEHEEAVVSEREVQMASQLIESLTVPFDHTQWADTYRAEVLDLIARKASGEAIEMPEPEAEPEPQEDLMAALEASLAAPTAKKGPSKGRKTAKPKSKSKAAA